MPEVYGAAMTLIIAGTFGAPGYMAWGAVAAVCVYRRTLSPIKEKDVSDA